MPWSLLGTFPITYEWQTIALPVTNAEVFRVGQSWDGEYVGEGKLLFRFRYDGPAYGGYQSIFPNRDTTLIDMPIPAAFSRVGLTSRMLEFKRSQWSRIYYDSNWQATIEAFEES